MRVIRLKQVPEEGRSGYSIRRLFTEPLTRNPDNVGFYQTTIPPHSRVKNHAHEKLQEILLFLTHGKVKTEKETISFEPGDLLLINPGEAHEIIAEEEKLVLIAVKLPNIKEDKVVIE